MQNILQFYKYHGTGNDFVMIDNRDLEFPKNKDLIKHMCDRRFGIGGDGLILLENDAQADFKMVYYNSDGNESTMCGNGGRCLVAFAHFLDLFEEKATFTAVDGLHEASYSKGNVKLKMIDVADISYDGENAVLNTGSPHFVMFVDAVKDFPVYTKGNEIRNNDTYCSEGINVNFVEKLSDHSLFVRTYERGVEDETFSCGTGATASALVFMKDTGLTAVDVKVLGGNLKIHARQSGSTFSDIWLEGPAVQVFSGKISI
ncbi:diaminopimelate epimerase [Kaistella sp. PBT33-4]|uniref:diaminopimelate epimerase n=1 Tax=Kaistella sp. PBT33-4 TaxID=3032000 RepID=UPI0023D8BA1C|nr:diaminopimelate epimerase [Kaistella sp. PBT33-4]MDF0720196.1 diaminopimelate epimerase [Kaistella sp. PBT33-4]